MKNIFKSIILIATLTATFCSCDDGFDSLNKNPNSLTEDVNIDNILYGTLVSVGYNSNWEEMSNMAQTLTHPFPDNIGKYRMGDGNSYWSSFYSKIKNVNEVVKRTNTDGDSPNEKTNALARILRVMLYHQATDLFGAMPYFEGGLGINHYQPKYDSQEVIYGEMLKELDIAMKNIGDAVGGAISSKLDNVYSDDLQKWKNFANSLKLRIATRMRFVDNAKYKSLLSEVMASGLIAANDDNFSFPFYNDEHSKSPYFTTTDSKGYYPSYRLVEMLLATNDPRLQKYATPAGKTSGGDDFYLGIHSGVNTRPELRSDISLSIINNASYPVVLMGYAEICFLKAEAILFGGVSGDANAEFRKGIEASLKQWGVAQSDVDTYMATSEATLAGNDQEKFKQVCIQKWIALYLNGHEAYAEVRRTGYPVIAKREAYADVQTKNSSGEVITKAEAFWTGDTNGEMPRRMEYPASELNFNTANYKAAVAKNGGNSLTSKLWWDAR